MRRNNSIMRALLCAFVLMTAFSIGAFAMEIDSDAMGRLELYYTYQDQPVIGAELYLYRIGDVNPNGTCSLNAVFAGFPVDSSNLTPGAAELAELLYSYALVDAVEPDWILTVDAEGYAAADIPVGLYLLAGQKVKCESGILTSKPILVALPFRYTVQEPWNYLLTVEPKVSVQRDGPMNRAVMKIWEDNDNPLRPTSIEVSLLRDREVVDTVVLSAENRWTHKWYALSEEYEWRVVEKPVEGYTVEVDFTLGIFLLTNTLEEEYPTEPTEPSEPSEPTEPSEPSKPTEPTEPSEPSDPTAPEHPSQPSEPTTPTEPNEPEKPHLPQTGVLWWPVPILVMLGIGAYIAAWSLRGGKEHEA